MIRTVAKYLESLDDGRNLSCLGERVKDFRTHPILRMIIRSVAKGLCIAK
jgi:aromatic ring hydroxylase